MPDPYWSTSNFRVVKVFVWNFRGKNTAWGHASMQCAEKYISWWPEGSGRVPWSEKVPTVYDAHPFIERTFRDDVQGEGGPPDSTVVITGLDEGRIKVWWAAFNPQAHGAYGPPSSPWSSLTANCSTVVARALTLGGGSERAPWFRSNSFIWTPGAVRDYALAIAESPAPSQ
jgi:hypothetical protein